MLRTGAGGPGRRPEAPHIGFLPDSTLPPLASQAFAFLAMVKLWPLQSFVPSQWTPFVTLLLPAKATAGAINVASAPAIATPFSVPFFIVSLLVLRGLLRAPPPAPSRRGGRSCFVDRRRRYLAASLCYARECYPVSRNFQATSDGPHVEFVSPPFVSSHGQAALLHDDDATDHV